jgi:outer membrane receptor protein involved in Fe transport
VEAALAGFRTFAQTGIVLQVNSSPVINPVLEVGQVSETIEVEANATLVETRSQGIGQVMENARILELPLNGRNVVDLIVLAGSATPGDPGFGAGRNGGNVFNTIGVSIAGGLAQGIAFNLDGALHNNPTNNLEMPLPFPDALQEFKVETGALSAQSGMHAAGAVNAVTKAGTNEFHGNLFEFVRNYKFNARNFFAASRDTLKRNQFGGTIGGPIVRNKIFFFGAYQGTTLREDPAALQSFVPTPATLAGDFTTFASAACNGGREVTLRAPFVNNRVDPSRLSQVAIRYAANLPKTEDPCGRVLWGRINRENHHQVLGKIDYQWSSNHSIFGRYLLTSMVSPPPYELGKNLLATNPPGADGLSQAFTFGDTYLFGANVVNAFRLALGRQATQRVAAKYVSLSEVGANVYDGYQPRFSRITVSGGGGFSVGSPGSADGFNKWATYALNDDVSFVRGNHQLAFGGSAARWDSNYNTNAFAAIGMTFNGSVTGLGMADFLTGTSNSVLQGTPYWITGTQYHYGLYAQDTWKMSPRLTFNLGLRWEPYLPLAFDGGTTWFDIDRYRNGIRSTQFTNAPPGLYYVGDPGVPGDSGIKDEWVNFSPRIGLAWDVSGDGRTSVRASYGLFYDFPAANMFTNLNNAAPWFPRIEDFNVSLENPWQRLGRQPHPYVIDRNAPFPLNSTFMTLRPDTKNSSVSQWNLSVQRQVARDWLLSATYIGNNTAHLWTFQPLNAAVYIPGNCQAGQFGLAAPGPCSTTATTNARRVLSLINPANGQYFVGTNVIDSGGTANYQGLNFSVQRRPASGMTMTANYTWSHCITDPFDEMTPGSGGGSYTDPNNRRADRGNCALSAVDIRHVFNLTAVAETPEFSNPTLRLLATGWRLSPILRIQSGTHVNITTTEDVALSGISSQRVDQVLADPYGDKSSLVYLNRAAFARPATGTRGNLGMSNIAGPGYWGLDAALARVFQVGESQRLEFRAEAFNITNSLRKGNPVANFNSNVFGTIDTAKDPRIMQFALKYVF